MPGARVFTDPHFSAESPMDFATSQARNSLRTIKLVPREHPFFDQTTFHFRRLGPCKNASKMLRVGLVAGMVATAVMVAAPVKAQTPTAAQPWYDGGSAVPLRFDLSTSNHMPTSHHANASSVTPRCGRSAASPPRRHQIRPRNTV